MTVRFWGTRGSIASPGPKTLKYGGNTSCVEVRSNGHILVFDAGTGIRELGMRLRKEFGAKPF
ncbi:MAG TPA: MBL fold metallo-hydrolase, partial [Bacteroidota bacterium]